MFKKYFVISEEIIKEPSLLRIQDLFFYIMYIIFFCFLELLYFRIAARYNIIDKPNQRSSHKHYTIRGGGVIFPIAVLCWFILSGFQDFLFVSALLLIALISFLDDIKDVPSRVRFFFQFLAVVIVNIQISAELDWHWTVFIFILIIGMINAWNFMDGINGITGSYNLITLGTLWYINHFMIPFTSESLLVFIILSLLVFNFFNFRLKARCFAGDIGSISIAFITCFLMLQLINASGNFLYIGFCLIYGLDTVTTIIFRLIREENIFEAHRSHFYQFLANEKKWSHLSVSILYSTFQFITNVFIVALYYQNKPSSNNFVLLSGIILISGVLFVLLRLNLEGYKRLFDMRI